MAGGQQSLINVPGSVHVLTIGEDLNGNRGFISGLVGSLSQSSRFAVQIIELYYVSGSNDAITLAFTTTQDAQTLFHRMLITRDSNGATWVDVLRSNATVTTPSGTTRLEWESAGTVPVVSETYTVRFM